MRIATAVILIMVFAAMAFASDAPKETDRLDVESLTPIVIAGELTAATPTWHRWRPVSYEELGLNCDLFMNSDYTTEPHYDAYCFNVSDSTPVEFVVDSADFDTVIYIYCDPFDPLQPTVNAVYMDDDDGVGLLSAIVAANGVTLTPGNDYWFIICSYSSTTGLYSVSTSGNVELCGSVPVENTNWGSIKGIYR